MFLIVPGRSVRPRVPQPAGTSREMSAKVTSDTGASDHRGHAKGDRAPFKPYRPS
jgi:hypothetical protein